MSSFIVSEASINSIVTFLHFNNALFGWLAREHDFDVTTGEGRRRLAHALHQMNRDAVNQRYGKGAAAEMESNPKGFTFRFVTRRDVANYKAARCLLYQCSEGTVPEQPHYKMLKAIIGAIANEIIQKLPEYADASWGD